MSEHHLAVVKDNYIIALYPNPQASLFQICSSGKRKKKKKHVDETKRLRARTPTDPAVFECYSDTSSKNPCESQILNTKI